MPGRPTRRPATRRKRRVYHRRKVCRFCADSNMIIDYKDSKTLKYFITERGKIIPRRISGTCALMHPSPSDTSGLDSEYATVPSGTSPLLSPAPLRASHSFFVTYLPLIL